MKLALADMLEWYSEKATREHRSGSLDRSMSEAPGRSVSSGAGATPVAASTVGKTSARVTLVLETWPAGMSGPATIIETPADSSYMTLLYQSPCLPTMSP